MINLNNSNCETETSQESPNAAMRTSHRLSIVSNCSFQKYWKRKLFFIYFFSSVLTVGRTIMLPFHTKISQLLIFFYFLSTFRKSNLTHWQPMWCSHGSVLRFWQCFLLRGCVIFGWRDCVIFSLTHKGAWFFLEVA